jgi:hypothetical protein
VLWEPYAEVVIAHVRRKIVSGNTIDALVGFFVDDVRFQYLDQRKYVIAALGIHIHLGGNNFKLDRIAISRRIVPMRQAVEAIVDHPQGFAQVFLAAASASQIGKIGGYARIVRWVIVFIENNALDAEFELFAHCDLVR